MENNKIEEIVAAVNAVEEKKSHKKLYKILAVIGGLVVVSAIAYLVYRLLTPDYMEDFDDDFEDEFDDEFFDDDDADDAEDAKAEAEA
ncbi:MAG: hypothetical protein J6T47_05310 [Lachnospiraceae bacterium]|nr:hypothetical protein [Lachnospiraceae bacterium]